ncbi:MAG: HEAT repeat domain-containing protein, partial [Deltaproteobacteria bacterium]|nr:HEAT repeat domain-containing protein [Deltaproteobacteria bacterium]
TTFPAADVINRVLTRLAVSEDRRVRKKCLSFVTRYGDKAREIVTTRIRPEHPWYFNRNLLTLLGDVGDESSVAAITPFLRHEDDRLRKAAIGTLTRIGGPEAGRVLAEAFDDQPVEVQSALVSLFAKDKTVHAVPKFVARLKDKTFTDANETLAVGMIHALGEIGDRSAAETLQSFLKRGGLMGMFAKQNDAIVAACIGALGRLGDASMRDQIRRFAHHSNPDVAKAAQQSIRLLEDQAG